jgi:hypothetical protein
VFKLPKTVENLLLHGRFRGRIASLYDTISDGGYEDWWQVLRMPRKRAMSKESKNVISILSVTFTVILLVLWLAG